jgi:peroxiredoxin
MIDHTDTLKIGDRAPAFSLTAANRPDVFSLTEACAYGPVILEFLRGTW